jgi:hypothetical protein
LILHQVARLYVQLLDARLQLAVRDAQGDGAREFLLRFRFIRDGARFHVQLPRLPVVGGEVVFELLDRLAGVGESVRLAVEAFVAVAADAAALLEEVFALRQHVCALQHAILRVALLATGLHVLALVERVEPETVSAMTFDDTGRRAPVAAVAT